MSTRDERLDWESKRLQEYVKSCPVDEAGHTLVEITGHKGNPPTWYQLTYRCRGLVRDPQSRSLGIAINHVIELQITEGYPSSPPIVIARTPIFHPNIGNGEDGGLVCSTGEYDPEITLAELVRQVGEMIRLARYWAVPETRHAYEELQSYRSRLPVDSRPFPAPVASRAPQVSPDLHAESVGQAKADTNDVLGLLQKTQADNPDFFAFHVEPSTESHQVFRLVFNVETFAPAIAGGGKQVYVRTKFNEATLEIPTQAGESRVSLTWRTPIFHPYLNENAEIHAPAATSREAAVTLLLRMVAKFLSYDNVEGLTVENQEAIKWNEANKARIEWLRRINRRLKLEDLPAKSTA